IAFDRALAAIGRMEVGGAEIAVLALDEGRPPGTRVVAGLRALDLDDVGTEVRKHLSGPRARQDPGKLEHADAGQRAWLWTWLRTWHGQLPSTRMGGPKVRETRAVWPENALLSIGREVRERGERWLRRFQMRRSTRCFARRAATARLPMSR